MFIYVVALSLVGWFVSHLLISYRRKWWMLILAPIASVISVFLIGIGLMLLETQQIGAQDAFDRFALSLLPASIFSVIGAIVTYRRSGVLVQGPR
ncbi:hypothetical protein LY56_02918 [Roseinatronobacter thiooxidans]|uniref:Uncharacterized protein n=1 Tax=Roseinatronobacter thiooxidans TaxID=121821 RepID=A0A2W7QLS6_9RHOB|nr:hypothetical protein [Roseinatronobacter thiooxidans]PZX39385.1 hypothetical protein LY56_02918 [Roseinatronobacter thiooxidans]